MFKDEKTMRVLMPNFNQLKRKDLRANKVTSFLRTSEQENLHLKEKLIDPDENFFLQPGSPTSPRRTLNFHQW